ncbi:RlpA-like double-psi beta-barrel-protein domain-containing protein-containing protein [Mycena leptocephala]|nr:RlpA-like double-psi beta-barrel-protein domain-containing protein-containing protein [Mycena leptocephala]
MKFTSSSLLPTSFLALAVNTVSGALIPRTTGPATFYNPGGNLGACGNPIQDSDFAVALNSADYAGVNGASITVNVQDLCPGCQAGGIDLTAGAFAALADPSVGVIEVTWNFD